MTSARAGEPLVVAFKRDLESKDDEKLAKLELRSLTGVDPQPVAPSAAGRALGLSRPPRSWSGKQLYVCEGTKVSPEILVRRLAFWESVNVPRSARSWPGASEEREGLSVIPTVSTLLEQTVRMSGTSGEIARQVQETVLAVPSGRSAKTSGEGPSPALRKKNEYLSHPLHKYKAKFFPRLARSLVNAVSSRDGVTIFDPFSGSGTAPLEASLMGLSAIGHDIDPLSVFIGRVKCSLAELDADALENARASIRDQLRADSSEQLPLFASKARRTSSRPAFRVPSFLIARQPARFPPEAVVEFEAETNALLAAIRNQRNEALRDWLLLALSHALATKISLRWMGTGDDRFALEVAKRGISSIFFSHLDVVIRKARTYAALREHDVLREPGPVDFGVHDATRSPLKANSIDGIVTSPPYLPAASGRETYLRSRAISLVALGLLSEEQVLDRETRILGSILATPSSKDPLVPESVANLAEWMAPQRARGPKSRPTLAYFENMRASLSQMHRVLKTGGRAAIVVSKYHRFYELVSRQVVRTFDMSAAVAEVASDRTFGIGFEVEDIVDIELPKLDFAARPGANGTYHESIVMLRKQ